MTKVIIDGDPLVYRTGFAVEKKWYWVLDSEDFPVRRFRYKKDAIKWINKEDGYNITEEVVVEPIENALQIIKRTIDGILNRYKSKEYAIFLSTEGAITFRHKIYPEYKANRDSSHKPIYYSEIRDFLYKKYDACLSIGVEADDDVSIDAWHWYLRDTHYIVCSNDKDLNQVPGLHYNYQHHKEYFVTVKEAQLSLYKQLLTGDPVDNIPGIPKIGPVTADKLVKECKNLQELKCIVGFHYAVHFDNPEETLERNWRLLRLLHNNSELDDYPSFCSNNL